MICIRYHFLFCIRIRRLSHWHKQELLGHCWLHSYKSIWCRSNVLWRNLLHHSQLMSRSIEFLGQSDHTGLVNRWKYITMINTNDKRTSGWKLNSLIRTIFIDDAHVGIFWFIEHPTLDNVWKIFSGCGIFFGVSLAANVLTRSMKFV